MKFFAIFIFLFFAFAGLLKADELYVKSKQAEVRESPTRKSKKDPILPHGAKVDKIKYKSKWYQVSYSQDSQNRTGWVFNGKLSTKEPKQDDSLTAANGKKISAEDISTGRVMRGVSPMAQKFATANNITSLHQKYLDYHHSFVSTDKDFNSEITTKEITPIKISSSDISKFLEDGKIGEFSEFAEKGE